MYHGTCTTCGEYLIGDGFNTVLQCPYTDEDTCVEPDADIIYCTDTTTFRDIVHGWSWRIRIKLTRIRNELKRITKWKC